MTAKRKPNTQRLLSLSLPTLVLALGLVSAGAAAATRDVALHGPNGDGGSDCGGTDAVPAVAAPVAADAKATKPAKKPPATRIKPIVPVRGGGDDTSTHAPRWHSFLPGMFR